MHVESVNCNKCGAPLEVTASTNFVTCAHCGSRLAIKRTGSAAFTEILEKIDQKTDAMARQLAELNYRTELERIDREWEMEREQYLTTDKQGGKHEPNALSGMVGGAVAAGFGLFWTIMAFSIAGRMNDSRFDEGPPAIFNCFPLFGLIFVGVGIWMMISSPGAASKYSEAKAAYQRRRAAVNPEQFHPKGSDSQS